MRRNADPEFPPGWLDGVTLCLRDLVAAFKEGTLDTQYPGWIGNLISVLWMAFGLGAMAFITSSMASSMMARAFAPTALIANVGDLTDRSVGVIRDAAGQRHLVSLHIGVKEYDHIDAGADALRREEIDAFVADAPVIDYWLAQNPSSGLRMVEETFLPDKFVFAVNRDHAYLADAVSAEIIRLYKSGRLADIGRRYFGPDFR